MEGYATRRGHRRVPVIDSWMMTAVFIHQRSVSCFVIEVVLEHYTARVLKPSVAIHAADTVSECTTECV